MKSSKFDFVGRKALLKPNFPCLTTPVPESNKFTPNHHLVSDISIGSDCVAPLRSKKIATKTSKTHKLRPNEKTLIRLRRKYGLPVSDNLNYDLSTSSSSSSDECEQTPPKKSIKESRDNLSECIANLKKKQAELKEDFERLRITNVKPKPTPSVTESSHTHHSSATSSCSCKCSKQTLAPASEKLNTSQTSLTSSLQSNSTEAQMLEYIRKQDEQLQQIAKQMDELLQIHKSPPNSNASITTNQSCSASSPTQVVHNRRTIETMTSFVDSPKEPSSTRIERVKDTPTSPQQQDLNKSIDYMDTSIEKVREDMKKDFDNAKSASQTVNSMFVEPGTFDEKYSDASTSSRGVRSSCSDTPERSFYRTSSPKRRGEAKQTMTRVYHSEQSFYVHQLATKYDLDNLQFSDVTNYKSLPSTRPQPQPTKPKTLYEPDKTDVNLQIYSISDMNTSVATRKYLQKYGLLNENLENMGRPSTRRPRASEPMIPEEELNCENLDFTKHLHQHPKSNHQHRKHGKSRP